MNCELFIHYQYVTRYSNCFDIYFVFLIGYFACCMYLDPLIQISGQNKQHRHSRHPPSYLVYESEGVVKV